MSSAGDLGIVTSTRPSSQLSEQMHHHQPRLSQSGTKPHLNIGCHRYAAITFPGSAQNIPVPVTRQRSGQRFCLRRRIGQRCGRPQLRLIQPRIRATDTQNERTPPAQARPSPPPATDPGFPGKPSLTSPGWRHLLPYARRALCWEPHI